MWKRKPSDHQDIASTPDERRSAMRYSVSGTPVLIGWCRDGVDDWVTIPAALCDISVGGAQVVAEGELPADAPIQLCLLGSRFRERVKARIIGRPRPTSALNLFRRRKYLLRIAFDEACPYEFFKAAIEGFVVETQVVEVVSDQFDSRYWR